MGDLRGWEGLGARFSVEEWVSENLEAEKSKWQQNTQINGDI